MTENGKKKSPECSCLPDDKCPLGRQSTVPRCTADDLWAEMVIRQRRERNETMKSLEALALLKKQQSPPAKP